MKKIVIFSRKGKPGDTLMELLRMCFPGCEIDCIFGNQGVTESCAPPEAFTGEKKKRGARARSSRPNDPGWPFVPGPARRNTAKP